MAVIKRKELPNLLKTLNQKREQIYLFFGERYLCREGADQLQNALLHITPGTVHAIDGDQEDHNKTLNQLISFSLLPGLQIYRVTDSKLFESKTTAEDMWNKAEQAYQAEKPHAAKRHLLQCISSVSLDVNHSLSQITEKEWENTFGFSKPAGDLSWTDQILQPLAGEPQATTNANASDNLLEIIKKGLPPNNILILCVDKVDKRQKLFTAIKKAGQVIDCFVESGSGKAAQRAQTEVLEELVNKTLADFNKTIDKRARELLFERVGFHPVAVVMETEKLALYVENQTKITCKDLDEIVGRTREDALFELTEAFANNQTGLAITILTRLLDNGIHGLAILATLRNFFRKLLFYRSLQCQPDPLWRQDMQPNDFQNNYLPALKKNEQWADQLTGHPYGVYKTFSRASQFSITVLKEYLSLLLQAEYRLKSSSFQQSLILQEMLLSMLAMRKR